jgi:hypothetical protein
MAAHPSARLDAAAPVEHPSEAARALALVSVVESPARCGCARGADGPRPCAEDGSQVCHRCLVRFLRAWGSLSAEERTALRDELV